MFECETWFARAGRLPVISQTFAIILSTFLLAAMARHLSFYELNMLTHDWVVLLEL